MRPEVLVTALTESPALYIHVRLGLAVVPGWVRQSWAPDNDVAAIQGACRYMSQFSQSRRLTLNSEPRMKNTEQVSSATLTERICGPFLRSTARP